MTPDEVFREQLVQGIKQANDLEAMMRTEGWKIFSEKMESMLRHFEQGILKATSGDMLMKAATSFAITKSVIEWPKQSVQNARQVEMQHLALENQKK